MGDNVGSEVLVMAHETPERDVKDDDESEEMPSTISPQEFYAAMMKRPDVCELMRRLAQHHHPGSTPTTE
jgi:hypothetical protein